MTGATLLDTLEEEYETELSRLGSSKALYALTGGEMETEAVRAGLADRSAAAADTVDGWTDGDHAEVFQAVAEMAREHAERIAGTAATIDESTPIEATLRGLDDADPRLGGLLAWLLVTDRTLAQAVGFFVGNADPQTADVFRDLRDDVDARLEAVLEQLDDADEDVAGTAASAVVEAAYGHYVETLEGLGVKVKPVC